MLGLKAGNADSLSCKFTPSNSLCSAGETPLMLAAKEDRPDVMRALLSHKAHVDAFSRQELRISFP
jgi:ankyrin repeat protein